MSGHDAHSFGVFKPVDHVVISFPTAAQAEAAARALSEQGLEHGPEHAIRRLTDRKMLAQIAEDRQRASPLAAIGQELNLIKAHEALARRGYHWLVVYAPQREQALRVAEVVRPFGAERAQAYGTLIIEELIEHASDTAQVAESPDRGLDAQTPSGEESERADLRPPPKGRA